MSDTEKNYANNQISDRDYPGLALGALCFALAIIHAGWCGIWRRLRL